MRARLLLAPFLPVLLAAARCPLLPSPPPTNSGNPPASPPANDNCANAIAVGEGTFDFDTTDATTDGPGEPACASAADTQIGADIWYCYTPSRAGDATVSLCGSSYAAKLAVYTGCTCPTSPGTALACDTDSCGAGGASQATFAATAGQTYLIRIGGVTGADGVPATGAGTMTLTLLPAPVNDDRANAIAVIEGAYPFITNGAHTDGPAEPACASGGDTQIGDDIWYCYTAAQEGTATVGLCGSTFATKLAVYTGCSLPTSPGTALVCDVDSCGAGGASQASFATAAGQSYLIRIGGVTGTDGVPATGAGMMMVSLVPAPPNDHCANAIAVGEGTRTFSTTGARTDGPDEPACASGGDTEIGNDIWYCYSPSATGTATVDLCGSLFDTRLAVYAGCTCPTQSGTALACNDNGCAGGGASQVTFAATAGQTYLIRIGGAAGDNGIPASGDGTMTISLLPAPANDDCANAVAVTEGTHSFTTVGARTDGPDEPACASGNDMQIGDDIWYCYTAGQEGTATVSLCGSSFATKLAVYNGCTCPSSSGAALACDTNSCPTGGASQVSFDTAAGHSYLIRIGGVTGTDGVTATGNGAMTISLLAAPANDDCPNAISATEGTHTFSTHGARTDGPGEPACASGSDSQIGDDIWYCYSPSETGSATVSLCGSSFNTKLAVYQGCTCPTQTGTALTCNDNGCASGNGSKVTFDAAVGQTYLIRVGGATGAGGTAGGNGTMTISLVPTAPTPSDSCADASPIAEGAFPFDTSNATTDGPGEDFCASPGGDNQIGKDVWFCYTPTRAGTVTFSTCGSSFDTKMAIYTGCACPSGDNTAAICNDDGCGASAGPSEMKLTVMAGEHYLVRVGGAATGGVTASGAGTLTISYDGLPDLTCNADNADPYVTTYAFTADDCEVADGCAQSGTRKLLYFNSDTRNVGAADLAMGNPAVSPLFEYNSCDQRYHQIGYAEFQLLDSSGQVVANRKHGFCLGDDSPFDPSANFTPIYNCDNQGLQKGWSDVYDPSDLCQFIDVTDVPPGNYTLRATANAGHQIPESDYGNNTVEIPVTIP